MKAIEKIFATIGADGMKHFIVSSVIGAVAKVVIGSFLAIAIVLLIGAVKEIYDKMTGKGSAEWKDMLCDIAGGFVGIV